MMFGVTQVHGLWYVTRRDGDAWEPCSDAYPTHGKAMIAAGEMARNAMAIEVSERIGALPRRDNPAERKGMDFWRASDDEW